MLKDPLHYHHPSHQQWKLLLPCLGAWVTSHSSSSSLRCLPVDTAAAEVAAVDTAVAFVPHFGLVAVAVEGEDFPMMIHEVKEEACCSCRLPCQRGYLIVQVKQTAAASEPEQVHMTAAAHTVVVAAAAFALEQAHRHAAAAAAASG